MRELVEAGHIYIAVPPLYHVKLGNQELHARLDKLENKLDTGFDQLYRHIDEFVKLHETLDIERRRELRDWKQVDLLILTY